MQKVMVNLSGVKEPKFTTNSENPGKVYVNGFEMDEAQFKEWCEKYLGGTKEGNGLERYFEGLQHFPSLAKLVEARMVVETLNPNCTKDGIRGIFLPCPPFEHLGHITTGARDLIRSERLGEYPQNPWLEERKGTYDLDNKFHWEARYNVLNGTMEDDIRADLEKYKDGFPEGYSIRGGLVGLQILLGCGSSELIKEARPAIEACIETLKQQSIEELNDKDTTYDAGVKKIATFLKNVKKGFGIFEANRDAYVKSNEEMFDF